MAPHSVGWDRSLSTQLATTERYKYTDKYKWDLQTNVNVCTMQKPVDSFPAASQLVPKWGAGISCAFSLLSQAGSEVLWWHVCSLTWARSGMEKFVTGLLHVLETRTSLCSSHSSVTVRKLSHGATHSKSQMFQALWISLFICPGCGAGEGL